MRNHSSIVVAGALVVLSMALVIDRGNDTREGCDLAVSLAADRDAFRRQVWRRPPLPGGTAAGFAFDAYRLALHRSVRTDPEVERVVGGWRETGPHLPEAVREFVLTQEAVLAAVSHGARTSALGRRPDPDLELEDWRLQSIGVAIQADAILAATDGHAHRALGRAMELVRFGSDLAYGGSSREQHLGLRFVDRGVDLMIAMQVMGMLTSGGRGVLAQVLVKELERPRRSEEILDGIAIELQSRFSEAHGPEGVRAWRELRGGLARAREGLDAGRIPTIAVNAAFRENTASGSPELDESCTGVLRFLGATLATETIIRERMRRLLDSIGP